MPIDFNNLPAVFHRLPEGLARLAVGWQMVPADDPRQVRMSLPEELVEAVRARDAGTLLLVGSSAEVPPLPEQRIRGVVATDGLVVLGESDPEQTAVYGRYVLRLTNDDAAVYEYPSTADALAAAYQRTLSPSRDRARTPSLDRAAAALLRRDLRQAQDRLAVARRSAGANHTVLAAMREALQPIADAHDNLAAGIARDVLDRQQRKTAEMDDDLADAQAAVTRLQSEIDGR